MAKGKGKGAAFEREVCKHLSRWVSRGQREDLYWRSAMSGGRATLGRKKGKDLRYQSGDICAVHPEGHALTSTWFIECKTYKQLRFELFLLNGKGMLRKFWNVAEREAAYYGRKPMMICRHRSQTFVIMRAMDASANDWAWDSLLAQIINPRVAVLSFSRMLKAPFRKRERVK